MAREHQVVVGDTLYRISRAYFGTDRYFDEIGRFNGLTSFDRIFVGQMLMVPTMAELRGEEDVQGPYQRLSKPHGLDGVISQFGDIHSYIKPDGTLDAQFEREHLGRAILPFPIPLSWNRARHVKSIYCNKELVDTFGAVFNELANRNLRQEIRTYGGCFNYRTVRRGSKLSTHAWAISVDLNPETNPMGDGGDMHPGVIECFRDHGFRWGGDWGGASRDPMHFQFATGY